MQFDAIVTNTSIGRAIAARPFSERHDMLRIEGIFLSKVRLQIAAYPENYSRPFIETMAHSNLAMRQRCAQHLDELYDKTMLFRFRANDIDLRVTPVDEWPTTWNSFEYGFTVFPLEDHGGTSDLLDEGYE